MADYQCTGVVEIPLANGKGVALVDAEDAPRVRGAKWYLHACGYAACGSGLYSSTLLHRVILDAPPGLEVDHINHDKLDCRKANLRLVNRSQNNQNKRGPSRNNRLGIRGVSAQYNPSGTVSYFARVQVNGKQHVRCGFRTPEDAALAAIELRRQYFTHSEECS